MADDIRSDIIINVDTSVGIAEIKNLQRQISQLNTQLIQSGAQQARSADNIQRNLINNINATGKFAASIKNISTTAESFTSALERNKLSMGEYFRYAGASTKTFGKLFKSEFDTIEKVARERVKTLQTQYIKLGRDANGAMKSIAVRPLALDMENLATKTAMAAQKQQLFNQLLKQGSTNLLNFGKNTQWAGRQLMVGFTIPLGMLATQAGKTFMQMEEQAIKFRRVYGDTFTATEETDKMIEQVQKLAKEFTKYGVEVTKTMELAADAAAMGLQNADLLAQVAQATRLAVLGGVEQQQALETTISLTSAFGTSAKDLAKDIEFLNAVENQTVTAIEDLTIAIPKAAPVIKQLGGDVKDLAFFLTAMKEGGINASEGANALKSGLASLINPTEKASVFLKGFGIDLKGLVDANMGDVKGLVIDFAQALDQLDPLNRARAIEQLFGKFQFARLSTLFQNVIKDGTQASRVLDLTMNSTEELAILAERELKRVEDSPMFKFKKAVEELKTALVPLGEAFVKAITPVIEFAKGFLDRFNEMGEGARNFAVIATTVVAGIGPILLMAFGLVANGVANLIKMFTAISNIFRNFGKNSNDLATSTDYLTQQQLESASVAASLDQSHSKLIQTFNAESGAVDRLAAAYGRALAAQSKLANIPIGRGAAPGGKAPLRLSRGIFSVPGPKGAGDVVPAMLSPGEAVIPAKQSQKYAGLIQGMIQDQVPGFAFGRNPFAFLLKRSRVSTRMKSDDLKSMLKNKDFQYKSGFETGTGDDFINAITGQSKGVQARMRRDMETDIMGIPYNADPKSRPTYGSVQLTAFGRILSNLFGLKGRQFRSITSPGNEYLDRYGDVDLVGKRRLGKRSTVFAGDLLRQYQFASGSYKYRRAQGVISGNALPPMFGSSAEQLDRGAGFWQFNSPFGKSIPSGPKNSDGSQPFISNPGSPYIEAHVAGGFNLREISKIRVPSRAEAKELQKLVDQAGLRIRVTPKNAPMVIKALANVFGTKFEQGSDGVDLQRSHLQGNLSLTGESEKQFAQMNAGYAGLSEQQKAIVRGNTFLTGSLVAELPSWMNQEMRGIGKGIPPAEFLEFWNGRDNKLAQSAILGGATPADLGSLRKIEREIGETAARMASKKGVPVKDDILASATSQVLGKYSNAGGSLGRLSQILTQRAGVVSGYRTSFSSSQLKDLVSSGQARMDTKGQVFLGDMLIGRTTSSGTLRGTSREYGSNPALGTKTYARKKLISTAVNEEAQRKQLARQAQVKVQSTAIEASKGGAKTAERVIDTVAGKAMNKRSRAASPSKETVKASKNLVDGVIKGVEDGGKEARQSGQKLATAYVDGTERVYRTASGQFRDRATKKRLSEEEGRRLMALDRQNERRRSTAELKRQGKERRDQGVSQTYGMSAAQFDKLSKEEQQKLRAQRKQDAQEAKRLRIEERNARISDEKRIAAEKQKLAIKEQKRAEFREKVRNSRARIAGGVGGVAMAGVMAGSMMGGQVGEIAQQLMMPAMMLPMILPMLTNPIGLAAVAIGGLTVAAFALNEQFKKNVKESYDLTMATGASAESLRGFSEFAGNVTAGEIMDRRRAQGADIFQIAAGKTGFGANFLQSEAGKSMKEAFAKAIETQGRDSAISQLTNQMAVAVASGALSAGQARDIVATLGKELNDYSLSISVNSQLLNLLGPNGENLLTDPLNIRVKLVTEAIENVENVFPELNLPKVEPSASSPTVTPVDGVSGPLGDFLDWLKENDTLGVTGWFDGGTSKEQAAAIGQFAALSAVALQTQQEMVDSLRVQYDQLIANAEAEGDLAEVARLKVEFEEKNRELLLQNAKVVKAIRDEFNSVDVATQGKILRQYKELANDLYKDDPINKAILEGAEAQLSALEDDKEVIIRAAIVSGDLSPTALATLLNAEDSDKRIDLLVKLGGAGYSQVSQIAELFGDSKLADGSSAQTKFIENLSGMDPKDALAYADQFNSVIQSFSALGGNALEVGMTFFLENPELLEKANKDIAEFKKISKGKPITIEMIQEVYGQDMVDQIKKDQEYFDSLPDDQKIIYTTVLKMLGELDPEALKVQAINEAMKSDSAFTKSTGGMTYNQAVSALGKTTADRMAVDSYVTDAAKDVTEASTTDKDKNKNTNTGGGDGGSKDNPIDSILAKLKQVRDAGINAAGGVKELMRVLGKGKDISKFLGTDQALRKKGVGEDVIDFLNGLDEADRKQYVKKTKKGFLELTKEGQALDKAFKEVAIGEFQNGLARSTGESNNQLIAFRKLTSAGMSVSQAMDAVQDSSLAAAVASKSFSAKELKSVVAEAKRAESALRRLQAVQSLRSDAETARGQADLNRRFRTNDTQFNELEQLAIQTDATLLQTYTDFLSGKIKSLPKEFGERLAQVLADVDFQQKTFDDAFGKAMEAFSAQETKIRLDFELGINDTGINKAKINLSELRAGIAEDENRIALINDKIDDYDAGIVRIADEEEKINESYDKRFDALDKIERANEQIARQQKSQLTIADALTQGDIAAAARAAQEMRADSAAQSIQSQREMLEATRDKQLKSLQTTINGEKLTREQIETRIKNLQKDIFNIEESSLEPKREQVRQAEYLIEKATRNLEVADLTRAEWEKQKNNIDSAVTSSNAYNTALTAALGLVKGIVDYWNDLDGKTVTTTHNVNTVVTTTTSPGTLTPPAEGWTWDDERGGWTPPSSSEGSTSVGGVFTEVKDKPNVNPNQKEIDELNRLILITRERVKSGDYKDKDQKERLMDINEDRIKEVRKLGGIAAANGGLVPKRYSMGGFIKKFASGGFALGTDTIPAMLTPGEFVVKKTSVENFGIEKLRAINSGTYKGDSMYNYEVNVSVQTDANPDQIARAVMGQIKQIDAQRIRGNRF